MNKLEQALYDAYINFYYWNTLPSDKINAYTYNRMMYWSRRINKLLKICKSSEIACVNRAIFTKFNDE